MSLLFEWFLCGAFERRASLLSEKTSKKKKASQRRQTPKPEAKNQSRDINTSGVKKTHSRLARRVQWAAHLPSSARLTALLPSE